MPRIPSALVSLCALFLLWVPRPASAASTVRTIHVIVRLAGPALSANTNLKTVDWNTDGRFRLDPNLPAAQAYRQALDGYQRAEIAYLRAHGIGLQVRASFDTALDGLGVILPASQLGRLRSMPGVVSIYPEHTYRALLDRSVPLTSAPGAWDQLGGQAEAGKGIRIANLDSGIDITNPCFRDGGFSPPASWRRGDPSFTNNKVIVARAFGSDPSQTYSPEDDSGHGTFTGAIEACDADTATPLGTHISGMAPDAYLMSYNIFPGGSANTADDQILQALNAAELDGADVVNMSFGGPAGDPRLDAQQLAINQAVKAGIAIAISAGNAGPEVQTVGSPADDPSAIAVGAVTNSRGVYPSVDVSGSNVPNALQLIKARQGSHTFDTATPPSNVVYVGLGRMPKDDPDHPDANDFSGLDLHGKIALIRRGTILFETKINNAMKAGAVGAIVFDNRQETELVTMAVKTATLPAMFISQSDGQALLAWLKDHPDAKLILDPSERAINETPNVLTDFSSRGYGTDYTIKPDLVAPGADIYSATESVASSGELYSAKGFLSADGTSFSAPHVTGAIALLLQKHPTWTPLQIKAALMNTATSAASLGGAGSPTPSVLQVGAGMVNVAAAMSTPALITPAAVSFGQVNVGAGNVARDVSLSITGTGTWTLSLNTLAGDPGLQISVPSSVTAGTAGAIPVHLAAAASVPAGDYDGYIVATNGSTTLRVPFYVHVASQAVKPASVLLVDDSTSRFQPDPGATPLKHIDVSGYYEKALTSLGKTYTYWNEAQQGTPSLADMKLASAVIYFTANNLNDFAAQNSNVEATFSPLDSTDVDTLHQYLDAGGHVFVTGMGAALSDPYWAALVMGAGISSLSIYDSVANDKDQKGGIAPPKPSVVVEKRTTVSLRNPWLFGGLKPIDIASGGDGANDNVAVDNSNFGLIGVAGMDPESGNFAPFGNAYGQAVLRTDDFNIAPGGTSGADVGIVSSDEPSLKHTAHYPGRAVLFSFGWEGINDNTGYATREQVLSRILRWFDDKPATSVAAPRLIGHLTAQLRAGGSQAVRYQWQVGSTILKPTTKATVFRFPRPGTYRLRVVITDTLGHQAISAWKSVRIS